MYTPSKPHWDHRGFVFLLFPLIFLTQETIIKHSNKHTRPSSKRRSMAFLIPANRKIRVAQNFN